MRRLRNETWEGSRTGPVGGEGIRPLNRGDFSAAKYTENRNGVHSGPEPVRTLQY